MKLLNYIHKIQSKSSYSPEESYKTNFCSNLSEDELKSLTHHQVLYKKVLDELTGRVEGVEEMSTRFNHYIENNVSELLTLSQFYVKPEVSYSTELNVSLLKPQTWSKPLWTYQQKRPTISTPQSDLSDIIKKLAEKQDGNVYQNISTNLKGKGQTCLDPLVLDYYLGGIRNNNLTVWDRFLESVHYVADFFEKTLNVHDMSVLLEYSITNEKFLFLLIWPYLFNPLKKLLWSYLYPVFSLTGGSFTFFLKKVGLKIGNIIKHKSALIHGFYNLKVSRSVKFTLGSGGLSGLLLFYNKYFLKDNTALIPLYTGLGGFLGQWASSFRLQGSRLIFEVTKTASTFTNAALAGFLEPKQNAVKQIMKSILKK